MKGVVTEARNYDEVIENITYDERLGDALVLGLDLGTNCGYAYTWLPKDREKNPGTLVMGQIDLSLGTYDSGAVRPAKLRNFIRVLRPAAVFMEDVKFTPAMPPGFRFSAAAVLARSSTAQEFFGVMKSVVLDYGHAASVPVAALPIGEIKKFATNQGNASKELMIAACNKQFGVSLDAKNYKTNGHDNIADAAFVLALGLSQYRRGIQSKV
jgi:hypothetical protein